jgi:carboxymethylenebutenolidase
MTPKFPRQTAADFDPEVLRLFDQYVHGQLDRRGFLDRAARFAVGGTTAVGLLAALSPNFAMAQKVLPGDARIKTERVEIASPTGNGKINALVARPAQATGPLPVVLVIHENRGLNPHIEDIARRLAVDNFIAVAPDLLTTAGGYPGDEDKAREAFAKIDQAKAAEDWLAAARYTRTAAGGNGKLGAVGFCYGGSMVNMLAVRLPELLAAAPFYGSPPALDQVARIKAEMAISHGGNDTRLVASWPAHEAALKAAAVRYDAVIYPGAEHGFNNDTTPRFDEKAAQSAWGRTVALFNRTLRA